MKKLLCTLMALMMLYSAALAAALVVAPQDIVFRGGPDDRYAPTLTLPAGSELIAINREDGWALCCLMDGADEHYAYASLADLQLDAGALDRPEYDYQLGAALLEEQVFSSPNAGGVAQGRLYAGEIVRVLAMNDLGTHHFVEYYNGPSRAPSRGWVNAQSLNVLEDGSINACYMKAASPVYAQPSTESNPVGKVFQYEMVAHLASEDGFDRILFYNGQTNALTEGYVPGMQLAIR